MPRSTPKSEGRGKGKSRGKRTGLKTRHYEGGDEERFFAAQADAFAGSERGRRSVGLFRSE
jgi:hypothetical protein